MLKWTGPLSPLLAWLRNTVLFLSFLMQYPYTLTPSRNRRCIQNDCQMITYCSCNILNPWDSSSLPRNGFSVPILTTPRNSTPVLQVRQDLWIRRQSLCSVLREVLEWLQVQHRCFSVTAVQNVEVLTGSAAAAPKNWHEFDLTLPAQCVCCHLRLQFVDISQDTFLHCISDCVRTGQNPKYSVHVCAYVAFYMCTCNSPGQWKSFCMKASYITLCYLKFNK